MTGRWLVGERRGTAAELHRPWPDPAGAAVPQVAVCTVIGPPALVLGSTQARRVPTGAGGVVVRRSGGGAVLVGSHRQVWIDIWVPRGDRRWDDDVVAAAGWVGDAWAGALTRVGIGPATVHRGRLVWPRPPVPSDVGAAAGSPAAPPDEDPWRAVCFAGLGPGEVVVAHPPGAAPRKVVGVSQHRSRAGARFLTMAPLRWQPAATVDALCRVGLVPGASRPAMLAAVDPAAAGLLDLGMPIEAVPGLVSAVVEGLTAV